MAAMLVVRAITRPPTGGTRWQGDNQLFFLSPNGTLMSAAISTANGFDPGVPKPHPTAIAVVVNWLAARQK